MAGAALGELTTLSGTPSRMMRGHLSPRFLMGVVGPRDNVFPGPAVALDGPVCFLMFNFSPNWFFTPYGICNLKYPPKTAFYFAAERQYKA